MPAISLSISQIKSFSLYKIIDEWLFTFDKRLEHHLLRSLAQPS